uniref:CPL domain-containing protein n=1 Tax=Corethron hystrix TaxID=216773 RepID=A0A7S1B6F1_9STRA|mmetsp:Transcript_13245/g.29172  ORF Transcript_13245/g.29172 Transcript_13245/m.29172 type:complete len:401 (+) Transcript_13245:297-1499(+)
MFGTRDGESKQEHREKAFNVFAKLLQEHRNDVKKRSLLLSHTSSLLHRMIDRSLLSLDYVQHLLWDYYDGLSSDADADLVGTSRADMAAALADHIPHMISSRRGASAACAAFGCAAAKDRKKMMRSLRGYVRSTLEHRDAHLVPLRMILTCDDTVSSKKFILDELLGAPPDPEGGGDPLLDLALHPTAHKMLLVLLSSVDPTTSPHFPPDERVLLAPTMVLVEGKLVSTSRKDPAVRRTELLKHAQTPVATLCRSHARTMMMDRCGAAVLREAFMVLGEEDRLANDVVASVTTEVLEHETGHLTLKRMLAAEVKGEGNGPKSLPLAEAMYKTYGKKLLETIGASNRGAFVLSVLATAGTIGEKVQKEIMKKKCMEKLKKKTGDAQNKKGYEALLAVLKQK